MTTPKKPDPTADANLSEVARRAGVALDDATALFRAIEEELALNRRVRIKNFGVFYCRVAPRRTVDTPPAHAKDPGAYPKIVPAHRELAFRASDGLKDALR